MKCILCDSKKTELIIVKGKSYYKCTGCQSIFLAPGFYIDKNEEKKRYQFHQNDVNNESYQAFTSPITERIANNFNPAKSTGLDFGCGSGPVITFQLQKKGFKINLYDPYFENHPEALEKTYNFIICCEVMEHFHEPKSEFKRLFELLKPKGKLYCKTSIIPANIPFEEWYYKNDPTHVFFYSEKSLEWIRENMKFESVEILKDVIVFEK